MIDVVVESASAENIRRGTSFACSYASCWMVRVEIYESKGSLWTRNRPSG